jgi:hypothetical protein
MLEDLPQILHVVSEVADLTWRLLITFDVVILISDRCNRG